MRGNNSGFIGFVSMVLCCASVLEMSKLLGGAITVAGIIRQLLVLVLIAIVLVAVAIVYRTLRGSGAAYAKGCAEYANRYYQKVAAIKHLWTQQKMTE